MRAAVMLAVCLSCAGCMLDAATPDDDDQAIGEVLEAMTSFTEPISFSVLHQSPRRFSVPNNGAVTVAAHASWDRPAACKASTYKIELVKKGLISDPGEGARSYPTSGATHTETWSGLAAGTYYLMLSASPGNPNCTLVGGMTVSIKP